MCFSITRTTFLRTLPTCALCTVFSSGLGKIHPFEAYLNVDDNAKPKFCKARAVPYSIRDAVEKELDCLEAEGILVKVDHSEWATPIVVVPKTNGKYRICGDFKVTLNPVLNVDQYPMIYSLH